MEVSSLLQIHPIYFCIHNDGKPPVAFTQRIFNHHDPHTHRSIKTSFTVVKPEGLFLLTLFHKSVTPPSRGWDFYCTFSTPLIFYKSPPITPPNHSTIASLCFNQSTTSPPPPNQCWRVSLAFPFKPHGKTVRLYFFFFFFSSFQQNHLERMLDRPEKGHQTLSRRTSHNVDVEEVVKQQVGRQKNKMGVLLLAPMISAKLKNSFSAKVSSVWNHQRQ